MHTHKFLELIATMSEMKNKLDRINGRFNIAEDSEDVTSGTHITRHKEK